MWDLLHEEPPSSCPSPWPLTMHFTTRLPPQATQAWLAELPLKAQFLNSLKEACFISKGSEGSAAVMRMEGTEQDAMWAAAEKCDLPGYRAVMSKLNVIPTSSRLGDMPATLPVRLLVRVEAGEAGSWDSVTSSSRPLPATTPTGAWLTLGQALHALLPSLFPSPSCPQQQPSTSHPTAAAWLAGEGDGPGLRKQQQQQHYQGEQQQQQQQAPESPAQPAAPASCQETTQAPIPAPALAQAAAPAPAPSEAVAAGAAAGVQPPQALCGLSSASGDPTSTPAALGAETGPPPPPHLTSTQGLPDCAGQAASTHPDPTDPGMSAPGPPPDTPGGANLPPSPPPQPDHPGECRTEAAILTPPSVTSPVRQRVTLPLLLPTALDGGSGSSGARGGGSQQAPPAYDVIIGGVQPSMDTPLAWLHAHMHAPDYFLYVVVRRASRASPM